MKAGFFNLFRWGRYGGGGHPSALNDDARHHERERFAVAAVAFCLTHHKEFRQHFLRNCCKLPPDASLGEIPHIAVEDKKWGDLAIWQPGQWAYVFEFKLGDGSRALEDHQNPVKTQHFWQKEPKVGYGEAIRRAKTQEFGCPKRYKYIVLGWHKKLDLKPHKQLEFAQLNWEEIVPKAFHRDPLLQDLSVCLGHLGVAAFANMTTKQTDKMKIAQKDARTAASALSILVDTAIELGSGVGQYWPDASLDDRYFGFNIGRIHSKVRAEFPKQLRKAINPDSSQAWLAWYGYEYHSQEMNLSVWFYCTQDKRGNLLKKLARFQPKPGNEADPFLVVRKNAESIAGHKEWFLKVLKAAV